MSTPVDRGQRTRATIFLLVATGVLLGMSFILGRSTTVFTRHATLHTAFDNVGGLIVGSSVRLAGLDVGTVSKIHFDPDRTVRRVDVDLTIQTRYLDRIRKDSVARVTSKGLLGDMIVDVSLGSDEQPQLQNGDHLTSLEVAGMGEVVENVQHAVGSIDKLATDIDGDLRVLITPDLSKDVGRMANSGAEIMEGIAHGPGLANAIIHRRSLTDEIDGALHDLRETLAKLDAAATDIGQLTHEIKEGHGLVHTLVYDEKAAQLAVDLQTSAANLAEVTRAMKEGNGALHALIYGADAKKLIVDLVEAARVVRKLADETEEGKGTIGGLLKDPTAYQDLTEILGNLKRNTLLKGLIRYSISKDGLSRPSEPPKSVSPDGQ